MEAREKATLGPCDFSRLQKQKQTLKRTKKVPREAPRNTIVQYRNLRAGRRR